MNETFDIAVIGSGFAGSLMAMIAKRLGYSVALIEKDKHPRVVIGESSTPLSNLLLEELADAYDLPMLKPLAKWGTWQKTYPAISCGLKRGFSFFHHDLDNPGNQALDIENQFFVAASPHDQIADTHWFRSDVDQFLVEQAQSLDVIYFDEFTVEGCLREKGLWTISGRKALTPLSIDASFIIDASGSRGLLYRMLRLGEVPIHEYPATSSLYCHFSGVEGFGKLCGRDFTGTPFPIDDAAVHHIFDGGWLWVLRFNNGWTSAGIAATAELATRLELHHGEAAWRRMLDKLPLVKQQFINAQPVTSFTYLPRLSSNTDSINGDGWTLLPAAAGFIDPLLSTGFSLTLLGIQRLAIAMGEAGSVSSLSGRLETYANQIRRELQATANLIGSLYSNMDNFSFFRTISLLYFAAASYSETARRLGKPELADSFLLSNDRVFAPEFMRLLSLARQQLNELQQAEMEEAIYKLIETYDVAGLCKRPKDNCYPVLADDLYDSAHKLGATPAEIERLLFQSGFAAR